MESGLPAQSSHTARDVGYLIIRLVLGIVFFAHGSQKLLGLFGGEGPAAFVQQAGVPAVLAWVAMFAEFFGSFGLISGVLPRLSALGILVVMVVAVLRVHLRNGFFMNWGGKAPGEGFEYHILVMAMCLLIVLSGPGRFALMPNWEGRLVTGR
ncbi:MAG: DoxX family protein [Armatimonadetes bacterium]|nr:DoxX family protein [Armatimonadota bacterium]